MVGLAETRVCHLIFDISNFVLSTFYSIDNAYVTWTFYSIENVVNARPVSCTRSCHALWKPVENPD
jgi:hypothetical protein